MLSVNGGYSIVVVVAKDTAGQKDLSMPEVKNTISQALRSRREQLLRAAFLGEIRSGAVVENLIAKRLLESQGRCPASPPRHPPRSRPVAHGGRPAPSGGAEAKSALRRMR